ncbi:MAG: oligosaccharide flippase family protein [Bacteroidetes bacterium]|nr:oligosaccharide flippase family protein [Bacteroidota bacterium]
MNENDERPVPSSPPPFGSAGTSGVLSQGLLSMLAYGVNFAASFFAIIGIINILGEQSFGRFALAIQIVAFTSMIADFGIGPVIMRRLAIMPGRAATVILEATAGRSLLLLPAWILSLGIGWLLKPEWSFFLLLNIMLLNVVVSSKIPVLRGTLDALFRSQSRMGLPSVTMALDALILLAAVIVIPASFTNPIHAMALYTVSNLGGALLLLLLGVSLTRRINTEPVRPRWSGVLELIRSSAPLAVFLLFNALHVSIDSMYLETFHGEEAVGVYNAALRVMSPLAVFPTVIAISAVPFFARASVTDDEAQRARLTRLFSLSVKTLLVGAVLLAGLGLTNSSLLVELAFRGNFTASVLPMTILFATFLPMALNTFLVELNNARGHLRNNTKFAVILAAVSLTAGALLINYFSATGAAVAKLLAVLAGFAFLILHSRTGIDLSMKPVIGKALMLFLIFIAARLLPGDLHWVVSNSIALTVTIVAIFVLRIFTVDELAQWKTHLGALKRSRQGGGTSANDGKDTPEA